MGIKQGGPGAGKWLELPITKSPKIIQCSVGHEGQHAIIIAEDGSTFFVGTPRRGEDGDSGNKCNIATLNVLSTDMVYLFLIIFVGSHKSKY